VIDGHVMSTSSEDNKPLRHLMESLLRLFFADGEKYVGEFKHGQYHGKGMMTYTDGEKYVGEYLEGTRHGQGTYVFANGDKYIGEYKNGTRHGQGVYNSIDGKRYVGSFDNGIPDGHGAEVFPSGKKFVGEFKQGKPFGLGIHTWPDGAMYYGELRNGLPNGNGTFISACGKKNMSANSKKEKSTAKVHSPGFAVTSMSVITKTTDGTVREQRFMPMATNTRAAGSMISFTAKEPIPGLTVRPISAIGKKVNSTAMVS